MAPRTAMRAMRAELRRYDASDADVLERRDVAPVLTKIRGSQRRAAAVLGFRWKALWERKRYGME